MKSIVIAAIFFLTLTSVYSQYKNSVPEIDKPNAKLEISKSTEIQNSPQGKDAYSDKNEKSPALGAVLSGLVPGAGQFYAKSYLKSALFIGVEAGLWILYAIFEKKGDDQTIFYQNYANQNWDVRRYAQWLVQENFPGSGGINPSEPDREVLRQQINICESQNFSHTLPPYGAQQYYEVIGKYQNYVAGWAEAVGMNINKNNYGSIKLPQVDYYMNERQSANKYYDKGTLTLTGVIINHLLSAVDGVLSVNSYNNKIKVKGNVSVEPVYSFQENRRIMVPHFNLSVNF